jgi:Ran GTPase-activating protein (RanGAP) involved in mRNA processing and transport
MMTHEQINLRHISDMSDEDVGSLPPDVSHLWIGPSFDPHSSVSAIVANIPAHVQLLDLDLNRMPSVDPTVCITLLQRLQKLTTLSLRFKGEIGALAVAKALPYTQSLECLDIRGNRIGDAGLEAIVKAFAETETPNLLSVRHLMLSWNDLTLTGVTALARYLEQETCVLERVDLSCNNLIGDDSVQELCRALRTNTSLVELDLFCCPNMSDAGALALLECLEHSNMTLQRINLQACHKVSHERIQQVQYWTSLNRAGRRMLRDQTTPDALWADILARCHRPGHSCNSLRHLTASATASDQVYFLIREKIDLVENSGSLQPSPPPPPPPPHDDEPPKSK